MEYHSKASEPKPEQQESILGIYRQNLEGIVGVRGMERYHRSKKRIEQQEEAEIREEQAS